MITDEQWDEFREVMLSIDHQLSRIADAAERFSESYEEINLGEDEDDDNGNCDDEPDH